MRRLTAIAITSLCSASIAAGVAVGVVKHREVRVVAAAVAAEAAKKEPGFYVSNAEAKKCVDEECAVIAMSTIVEKLDKAFDKGKEVGASQQKDECWANAGWNLK